MTKFKGLERPAIAAEMHDLLYNGRQWQTNCPTCGSERKGKKHSYSSIAREYGVSVGLVSTMVAEHHAKLWRDYNAEYGESTSDV
tara:strand:- start:100 stop:354 length:255 start_codon:yes stop_codon:yes gene_type:complete